jgi:signal transduction histidine kinase
MAVTPLDMDSLILAAHAGKLFGLIHRVAYAFVTPDLVIQRVSSNFYSAFSPIQEGSCIGQPLTSLLWELVGAEESLQEIMDGNLPYLAFERVNRQDSNGRTAYLDLSVTKLDSSELGRGLLVALEDVTYTAEVEQRLTQNRNELALAREELLRANAQLQRLNRQKTLFLSMAAHDLRGPLSVIRNSSDLIAHTIPADTYPKALHYLHLIDFQTNHMDWLIRDFLDLDQIEQGILTLRLMETDLNELILKVVDLARYLAERRELSLELNLTAEPMRLEVDAGRIQQALYNLLNNAVKFNRRGGQIVIESFWEGDTAVLRISDNGFGMTAEERDHAFQLYYQGSTKKEMQTQGKGLGLYIVKLLVEVHGGRITLESEWDKGSRFTIYLPRNP